MFSVIDTIKKSFKLAWKHKILWVFSLLIVGGYNFGNSFDTGTSNNTDFDYSQYEQLKQEYNYENDSFGEQVLGVTTKALTYTETTHDPYITNDIGVVKDDNDLTTFWKSNRTLVIIEIIITGISFLTAILFTICVGLIVRSWALGAFLRGIDHAIEDKQYSLSTLGSAGRISMRQLVYFSVKVGLLVLLLVLFLILIVGMAIFVGTKYILLAILVGLVGLLFMMYLLIKVGIGTMYSVRLIVYQGISHKGALKRGILLFKQNVKNTLKTYFGNFVVILVIGFAAGIIGVVFALFGGLLTLLKINTVAFMILMMPFVLAFTLVAILASGYINLAMNFTYTYLYRFVSSPVDTSQNYSEENNLTGGSDE